MPFILFLSHNSTKRATNCRRAWTKCRHHALAMMNFHCPSPALRRFNPSTLCAIGASSLSSTCDGFFSRSCRSDIGLRHSGHMAIWPQVSWRTSGRVPDAFISFYSHCGFSSERSENLFWKPINQIYWPPFSNHRACTRITVSLHLRFKLGFFSVCIGGLLCGSINSRKLTQSVGLKADKWYQLRRGIMHECISMWG